MAKTKKTKMIAGQYRQGDVLIERHAAPIGKELVAVPAENGRVILAHGEATGHAHALSANEAHLLEARKTMRRILRVIAKTAHVVHEEHHRPEIGKVVALDGGDYEITRQVEYTPEEIRTVHD